MYIQEAEYYTVKHYPVNNLRHFFKHIFVKFYKK